MKKASIFREKTLMATGCVAAVIIFLFAAMYFMLAKVVEERAIMRMNEGVNTAGAEIVNKLNRDSVYLNILKDILADNDSFDQKSLTETLDYIGPFFETMEVYILLPDNTIIGADEGILKNDGSLDFKELAAQGEHVSDREVSVMDGNTEVLRHYVPVKKDGETKLLLYGVTILEDLPGIMNIDNIYNASASAYIVDRKTGEFILNTWHEGTGSIYDFEGSTFRGGETWDTVVERVLSGARGYVEMRPPESDDWMYFYYMPATVNQWSVAVSVPNREALESVYEMRTICVAVFALILLTILIYYLWVYRMTRLTMENAVEQAVLEEKLHKAEAAERAKTMFLSNMSHDIRTPMNAIIGFTTLAQTNIGNRQRVQDYLAKILSSSNHLLSLINDILDMSRIESGRLNIEEKECRMSDIFRDMRTIVQTQMQNKQISFFMDTIDVIDEDIYCDKLHVNQVLLNLLSNAIKFTPVGGTVSLVIKQLHGAPKGYGSYEIRVKDTGIGMSTDFVEHIFEPFERERNSTVSGIQGTGLGMPITKSIVEAMGGRIRIETEQGKGTEFIVNLEFRLAENRKYTEKTQDLAGLHALAVDDSFTTCDSIARMLQSIGMRTEWTLHGREAVMRAVQAKEMGDPFGAYIIDWALPDLNGIEVVRQIRSAVGDDSPIIILTAYDWTMFENEAREAGVTAFCNKPVFLSELRDILCAAVSKGEEAKEPESPVQEAEADLKGRRLLLVEDVELNREIAEEILREGGFVVESAVNGAQAVDMVRESEPGWYDLILMDVQMPVMNGYEATRAIRNLKDPALANIPIIAMTANAFEEDKKEAMESGMNAHVAKPIDVAKLMEILHTVLRRKDQGEQDG